MLKYLLIILLLVTQSHLSFAKSLQKLNHELSQLFYSDELLQCRRGSIEGKDYFTKQKIKGK